jgi:extracellular elastinolytic metalloproteinase
VEDTSWPSATGQGATHVRLRVLTNQCTGTPAYQGDQDDDPLNVTDCDDGSTQDENVRAAELQVFR